MASHLFKNFIFYCQMYNSSSLHASILAQGLLPHLKVYVRSFPLFVSSPCPCPFSFLLCTFTSRPLPYLYSHLGFLHHSFRLPFFFLPAPGHHSHPALWDKENAKDQFCSVTFGGGLQSKGMAGGSRA